jgi:hypothetical protein
LAVFSSIPEGCVVGGGSKTSFAPGMTPVAALYSQMEATTTTIAITNPIAVLLTIPIFTKRGI